MKEIESKIIEVDKAQVEARLKALGAIHEFTAPFEAAYFDGADGRLKSNGQVLRLRMEGDVHVLTFKSPVPNENPSVKMREELEVRVDNREVARKILEGLGFIATWVLSKQRTQWKLGASHVVIEEYIDQYAHIPTFIEIESPSVPELEGIAVDLGFSIHDLKNWSAEELVRHYERK